MTLIIQRYRFTGPEEDMLRRQVSSTVRVVKAQYGALVDMEIDQANLSDLHDSMKLMGYTPMKPSLWQRFKAWWRTFV